MTTKTLAIKDAFKILGVSPPTGYKRLISTGKLKTYKIGRRRYTTDEAVEKCRRGLFDEMGRR